MNMKKWSKRNRVTKVVTNINIPYIHIYISKTSIIMKNMTYRYWDLLAPRIPFKGKVQEMVRRFIITYKISRWTMVEENKNRLKSLADFTKWSRQNRKGLMQIAYYMTVSCIVYFITVVQWRPRKMMSGGGWLKSRRREARFNWYVNRVSLAFAVRGTGEQTAYRLCVLVLVRFTMHYPFADISA